MNRTKKIQAQKALLSCSVSSGFVFGHRSLPNGNRVVVSATDVDENDFILCSHDDANNYPRKPTPVSRPKQSLIGRRDQFANGEFKHGIPPNSSLRNTNKFDWKGGRGPRKH